MLGGSVGWGPWVGYLRRAALGASPGGRCPSLGFWGPGRFGRRFGVLLPGGRVLVVRLGSAVAGAGCGGWQRLVVGGGSLFVWMALGIGISSQTWLVALSWGFWSAGFGGGGCGLWWAEALTGCGPPVRCGAWRRFA